MDVALLNQKILVQKNEVTVDAIGNHLNQWVDFYSCYATISGESPNESTSAGTVVPATLMTRSAVSKCQRRLGAKRSTSQQSFATMLGIEEGEWYVFFNNIKFSMLIIIFIGAFFPILLNTVYGVSSVRSTLIDSARVLGASERDIFTKILLPAAAPSIVTGMRLGLGVAWMCLVAAEMMPGSISGIGYVITHAYTVARTDIVIAGMVSIGAVGLALDAACRYFEARCFAWQRLSR